MYCLFHNLIVQVFSGGRYNTEVRWITFCFEIRRELVWALECLLREIWVVCAFSNHLSIWRINFIYPLFCIALSQWGASALSPSSPLKLSFTQGIYVWSELYRRLLGFPFPLRPFSYLLTLNLPGLSGSLLISSILFMCRTILIFSRPAFAYLQTHQCVLQKQWLI